MLDRVDTVGAFVDKVVGDEGPMSPKTQVIEFDVTLENTSTDPDAVMTAFAFQSKFSESPALASRIGDKAFYGQLAGGGEEGKMSSVKKNGTSNGLFGGRWKGIWGRAWGFRQSYYDFLGAHPSLSVVIPEQIQVDVRKHVVAYRLDHPEEHILPPVYQLDLSVGYAHRLGGARRCGTLEQLIVSPVRRPELIVGKIVPYVVIGYVQMTLILTAGRLVFDVPVAGSLWLLYGLAFLFIAANLAIGLFFSTLARTQQQAMQMSFFFLLPNILLSGFMFPFEAMPRPAQWLAEALPLTHFMRIVRGIVLRGSRFTDLHVELWWLGGILCALVAIASLRFRKKLA